MKLRSTLLLAALAALVPLVAATAARPTAPAGPNVATAAGKSCNYVIRRIHGRRRRVRVCRRRSPVVARIDVGTDAWTVAAADDGGVWSEGAGGVVRIDPTTNRISLRTRFDGGPSAGAGSIWVACASTHGRIGCKRGSDSPPGSIR